MKNCKRITQIISDGQERPLKPTEKIRLRSHLFFCPGCSAFQDNTKALGDMMKSFEPVSEDIDPNSPPKQF